MSKPNLSFRIPKNLRDEIEAIKEEEGIEDRSEAARQVLRRGIEHSRETSGGERLAENGTAVAGVGTVVAAVGTALGQAWAVSVVVPFAMGTLIFAVLWASVRALEGADVL